MQQRYYDPQIGRFLSVDPVTAYGDPVGSFNRYKYANGNPYKNLDPNGEATVYRYANKIIIVQTFKNNGTQFTNAQISEQASSFSGTTSGGVQVEVKFVQGNDSDAAIINSNPNLDDTSENSNSRSHTNSIGGRLIELAPNAASAKTAGHELGHVLWAGDQYKDGVDVNGQYLTDDVPGDPNIMKTGTGSANQQTIDEIFRGAAKPSNTQIDCSGEEQPTGC